MSHFTTVKTQIRDIPALTAACEELGLAVSQNAIARGYVSKTTHGEFVIHLKGPYDIAVNREPDGTYGLTTDWWRGHVEKEVGKDFSRLRQLYGVQRATAAVRAKGWIPLRRTLPNGSITITATT